jgi:hypothetical protein
VKTYLFQVELEQEDDGRWSAWIETLPGCAAWGYSKEEALEAIKETTTYFKISCTHHRMMAMRQKALSCSTERS